MKIRKTGKTLEIIEGGEDLPEGETAQVYTAAELRRLLCLDHFPSDEKDPETEDPSFE